MKNFVILFCLSAIAVGCASRHSSMKGSVAMKLDAQKGVACLFGETPKAGDELTLFQNECTEEKGREGSVRCKLIKSGTGTISKMLNDHYAEFKVSAGTKFEEGSIIELSK